jgi:hypothetical protein
VSMIKKNSEMNALIADIRTKKYLKFS